MLAGRYEFKFPLGAADRAAVLACAREVMRPDPHGVAAVYRIASLYYDSPDRLAYREKLDGELRRRKFRLRWYPDDSPTGFSAAFFEIKHRIDQRVSKERIRLEPEGALALLSDPGELVRLAGHARPGADPGTLGNVLRQVERQRLEPVTVISYVREAWMGALDERLRVTFDSEIQAHAPSAWTEASRGTGRALLPQERLLLEVKFDRRLERWLRDAVVDRGLLQRRFSKYAAGVVALGLAPP